MGIYGNVVRWFTGEISSKKDQKITWSSDGATAVEYTSAFMSSVEMFIAREFSKLEIDHRIYTKQPDNSYLTQDKYGSDIFETLNYSPNGYRNNIEWKREIVRRLVRGVTVYLKPTYSSGRLTSLVFTDYGEYDKKPDDILVITSPVYVSDNSNLYDNILTNIGRELETNKLRGYLKINATVGSLQKSFKDSALEQLEVLQSVASYNGLGVIDNKAEIIELNNDYSTIDPETVTIIKREILNGFGFSENLLTGSYTEEEYRHFFDNVLAPIIKELETELTYKLLTNNARINTGDKMSFERIVISIDVFKFASVDQLINLASSNTNGAYLTVNEIRQKFGHDPISGGDVFRTNLNSAEVTYNDTSS